MGRKADAVDRWAGGRLRVLRESRGLSLEAVGEILEVSQQQVSRYEHGHHRLSAGQIFRLARGFDVPVSWFFEGYQEKPEELHRLHLAVREDRNHWRAGTPPEAEQGLLVAWRALPDPAQREAVLRMLEAFSLQRPAKGRP